MRTVRMGDRDVALAGGALTPLAWHRAFGDDALVDAAVRIDRYLATDAESNAEAVKAGEKTSYTDGFPATDVLKCAYALAWTADYATGAPTPPFEAWLAQAGGVDVFALALEVSAELSAGLFRRAQR